MIPPCIPDRSKSPVYCTTLSGRRGGIRIPLPCGCNGLMGGTIGEFAPACIFTPSNLGNGAAENLVNICEVYLDILTHA